MAKYNLYKVNTERKDSLVESLQDKGFVKVLESDSGDFHLETFFTPDPIPTDVWWLEQYSEYFGEYTDRKNRIYSGAILASSQAGSSTYLIALGKAHFYVQPFIEIDFGLNFAEKIADISSAKLKSSKRFAGATSKSIISFSTDSLLAFNSGEAAEYVKLKPSNKEDWGKSFIHFGTSVQFGSVDCAPSQIGTLLQKVDQALQQTQSVKLPRMLAIKDPLKIDQLDQELAAAIQSPSSNRAVEIYDYDLYGTDFVFSQNTHVKLKFKNDDTGIKVESSLLSTLTLESVRDFVNEHGLNLSETIREIQVQVFVDETSKFHAKLVALLEYVGDENTFLYKGKWFYFNQSFLEYLTDSVSSIATTVSPTVFTKNEHEDWRQANPTLKVNYREQYVLNKLADQMNGFVINDRELDYKHIGGKKLSIEISDLIDRENKTLLVAKIGEAKDFAYAANQASTALSMVDDNKYRTEAGEIIDVEKIVLFFACTNATTPSNVSDVSSINFLLQLNELLLLAREKKVELSITFAKYES